MENNVLSTEVSVLPAKDLQIVNGNAKLSVWRNIFSIEAKKEREKIVNRQQAKAIFEQLKEERSGEKVKESKQVSAQISANLKHFATVKANMILVITFLGNGYSLPIEAKTESELLSKAAKIGEDWQKIIDYRKTVKGTGVSQKDIIDRSPVRFDLFMKGKIKQSFASHAYTCIGQSYMGNLKNTVEAYLLSFTMPTFDLFQAPVK